MVVASISRHGVLFRSAFGRLACDQGYNETGHLRERNEFVQTGYGVRELERNHDGEGERTQALNGSIGPALSLCIHDTLLVSLTSFISSSLSLMSGAVCVVSWTWFGNGGNMAGNMTLSPVLTGLFRNVHRLMYPGPRR